MNERYDRQLTQLQTGLQVTREREHLSYETGTLKADVKAHMGALTAKDVDEPFCKSVLDTVIVHPDRHLEVRLNLLTQKWRFVLDSIADIRRRSGAGCHYDPLVPAKGSKWNRKRKLTGIPYDKDCTHVPGADLTPKSPSYRPTGQWLGPVFG